VDTSDYDPLSGLNSASQNLGDPQTDAAIPKVGKLMMDMLVKVHDVGRRRQATRLSGAPAHAELQAVEERAPGELAGK